MGLNKRERGAGAGGDGRGNSICAWELYILEGDTSDGFGRNAPVYHVYPVSCTTSEETAECSKGWMVGGWGKRAFNSFRSHRCRGLLYVWC